MYFAHTALAIAWFAVTVKSGDEENSTRSAEEQSLLDDHTFVVLIDIVFTDYSKKTCTGSIIHDNVVITAAHCFKSSDNKVSPELTASFVVIGTKSMFDTGYEQYLPIERVLTHPKFKGWTADLCLVYTFAGMTSDKPGTIIPLAEEQDSRKLGCNVTILSWGHITNVEVLSSWEMSTTRKNDVADDIDVAVSSWSDEHVENKDEKHKKYQKTKALRVGNPDKNIRGRTHSIYSEEEIKLQKDVQKSIKRKHYEDTKSDQSDDEYVEKFKIYENSEVSTKLMSQYLAGSSGLVYENKDSEYTSYWNITNVNKEFDENRRSKRKKRHDKRSETKENFETAPRPAFEDLIETEYLSPATSASPKANSFKSYYQNWRRQMGTQQNKLSVESFKTVNTQSCKSSVKEAMPSQYDISESNDVVCYSSKYRFINDDDSGAPAISDGQLVAVIVGGTDTTGDRVAIGIKMLCYCSWISENVPNGDSIFNCCQNCCNKEETSTD